MNAPYEPIACAFHSVLEEAVLRDTPKEVLFREPSGALWCIETVVQDVFAQGGAEYVQLEEKGRVRLDRIVRIGDTWPEPVGGGVTREPGPELARAVLRAAAKEAERVFGERLRAAYALGSLAHGGFAPNVSDVDLGLVLAGPLRDEDEARIRRVAACIREAPMPLAGRLSIFWGSRASLRGEKGGGRFPAIDRLDLVRHGRLLCGEDVREAGFLPERRTLDVENAQFALRRLATPEHMAKVARPSKLMAEGIVGLTKAILLLPRILYAVQTGDVGESEKAVCRYTEQHDSPSARLVRRGLALRTEPFSDENTLLKLMRTELSGLYATLADGLRARMEDHGESERASDLKKWQRRLRARGNGWSASSK